eukprot:COSAG01_NODE_20249_length_963_cov_37.143519_1_plen_113_part_00
MQPHSGLSLPPLPCHLPTRSGTWASRHLRCRPPFARAGMVPWYRRFAGIAGSPLAPLDEGLCARLEAANAEKVAAIDGKIKDAEENLGESEVRDAKMEKASHFDTIGDQVYN